MRLHFLKYELLCDSRANFGTDALFLPSNYFYFLLVFFGKVFLSPSCVILWIPWNRVPTHALKEEESVLTQILSIMTWYPLVSSNWLREWVGYTTSANQTCSLLALMKRKNFSLFQMSYCKDTVLGFSATPFSATGDKISLEKADRKMARRRSLVMLPALSPWVSHA